MKLLIVHYLPRGEQSRTRRLLDAVRAETSGAEALRLHTIGSSWFSGEEGKKGAIVPGQLADIAVLSEDYFSVPEERIKDIHSVLTLLGGKPVWASGPFSDLAPAPLPVSPDWSPVARFGGYGAPGSYARSAGAAPLAHHSHPPSAGHSHGQTGLWGSGCSCFAF